jgi:hypothetical protein
MPVYTNKHNLPAVIVDAVVNDPYVGGGDVSATKLIDAPQVKVLGAKYRDQVQVDVSERVWSLLGQCVHTILERAGLRAEGMIAEHRMFAEVVGPYGPWQLSGQADVIDLERGVIRDYKVTTVFKAKGSKAWERQLNVLAWLARANGYQIHGLEIVGIFRDWRKVEAERNPNYPQAAIQVIPIALWDPVTIAAYITERVALHQSMQAGVQVDCTDEERWKDPDQWAIVKPGLKRALKVLDHDPAPSEIPEGCHVEVRRGEYKRCQHYCEVAPWCPQWAVENMVPDEEET